MQLLGQGDGASWGPPGKLPAPGQYCYESLQMARYETGQHFLAHEVRRTAAGKGISAAQCAAASDVVAGCYLHGLCSGGVCTVAAVPSRLVPIPPAVPLFLWPCLQDGFPAGLARSNGFQRHATLLLYLNSTQEVRASMMHVM